MVWDSISHFTEKAVSYDQDSKFFIPLVEPLNAEYFIGDNDYDSTENIGYAITKGSNALIAIKDDAKTGIRKRLKNENRKLGGI